MNNEDSRTTKKERVSWAPAVAGGPPTPLIKMPGSKRWLVPALIDGVAKHLHRTDGKLVEPFAGSAAVSLALGARDCSLVVSDLSAELTAIHVACRDSPTALHEKL